MNIKKEPAAAIGSALSSSDADVKAFVDYIKNPVQNANFDVGATERSFPLQSQSKLSRQFKTFALFIIWRKFLALKEN
jgi:hypothetical protein